MCRISQVPDSECYKEPGHNPDFLIVPDSNDSALFLIFFFEGVENGLLFR